MRNESLGITYSVTGWAVKLSFSSNRLQRQLESAVTMQKAFGDRANHLRRRLSILREAACLSDVPGRPPERRHPLKGDRRGQYAVVIKDNWRLVFEPDHDPLPVDGEGALDLRAVTAIRILEIVDYHGE